MSTLPDFRLETHFSKWEFKARYNMTGSDAQSMSLSDLLGMASAEDREAFDQLWLGYTETYGAPELREAIADTYDSVQASDILCFAGAEEAIYTAMRVMLEPQDHVIVITPNYQAAETVPLSICEVSGVPLDIDNRWSLDIDQVRAAVRPNTRLISINFPNNPTGKILPRADFDALVELCREHDLWLFSDEVYRLIEREPQLRLPQAVDAYEKAISLNVMSKAYGMPGLRIGWLACKDHAMLQRLERYKHYLSICNSAPSEQLALIALKNREPILERNRTLVRENLALYDALFKQYPKLFDWQLPDGGCVGFIRYLGDDGVESFCERLVEEAGVLFLPSSIYRSELGEVPTDCFRFGFGRSYVPEGLEVLGKWMSDQGYSE